MSDSIISIQNISKAFPKKKTQDITVLEDIDLSLRESEIVCLLGTSGSGKSTLLRIMAGLIEPSGEPFIGMGSQLTVRFQALVWCFKISLYCPG